LTDPVPTTETSIAPRQRPKAGQAQSQPLSSILPIQPALTPRKRPNVTTGTTAAFAVGINAPAAAAVQQAPAVQAAPHLAQTTNQQPQPTTHQQLLMKTQQASPFLTLHNNQQNLHQQQTPSHASTLLQSKAKPVTPVSALQLQHQHVVHETAASHLAPIPESAVIAPTAGPEVVSVMLLDCGRKLEYPERAHGENMQTACRKTPGRE
ncbi:hypothetical protein CHARACLAT_032355, partial [Characodon lateralis]|nr:hypothetical protein [Characodon lateralis]